MSEKRWILVRYRGGGLGMSHWCLSGNLIMPVMVRVEKSEICKIKLACLLFSVTWCVMGPFWRWFPYFSALGFCPLETPLVAMLWSFDQFCGIYWAPSEDRWVPDPPAFNLFLVDRIPERKDKEITTKVSRTHQTDKEEKVCKLYFANSWIFLPFCSYSPG